MESSKNQNQLSVPSHSRSQSDFKLNRLSYSTFDSQSQQRNLLDISNTSQNFTRTSLGQQSVLSFKKNHNIFNVSVCKPKIFAKESSKMMKISQINQASLQEQELKQIQRKTQELANKQRQQRKQLKKLRKMYQQKLEQLRIKEEQSNAKNQAFQSSISVYKSKQCQLIQQKQELLKKISQLQRAIDQLELNLKASSSQKQILWNKIQLFEANCQCGYQYNPSQKQNCSDRVQQIICQAQQYQNLCKQMEMIDKTISQKTHNSKNQSDYKEIIKLYQIRKGYQKRRASLQVERQKDRLEKTIEKLNKLVIHSYKKFNNLKNRNHTQESLKNSKLTFQDKYDSNAQTCQSFFSKRQSVTQQDQLAQSQLIRTNYNNESIWSQIKKVASCLIDKHIIKGFQGFYWHTQEMIHNILDLYQQNADKQEYAQAIDRFLKQFNKVVISKARKNSEKIRKLMTIVMPQNLKTSSKLTSTYT